MEQRKESLALSTRTEEQLTCAVSLLHVQSKAAVAAALEAADCVPALPEGAHPRKGFALVDI